MNRPVHDILYALDQGKAPGPCAFIQHGTEEAGFEYECVCPWCAQSVGDRIPSPTQFTFGALLTELKKKMKDHVRVCTADMRKMRVYVTKTPLGTDSAPKVQ
jgi:hypothetical protein